MGSGPHYKHKHPPPCVRCLEWGTPCGPPPSHPWRHHERAPHLSQPLEHSPSRVLGPEKSEEGGHAVPLPGFEPGSVTARISSRAQSVLGHIQALCSFSKPSIA